MEWGLGVGHQICGSNHSNAPSTAPLLQSDSRPGMKSDRPEDPFVVHEDDTKRMLTVAHGTICDCYILINKISHTE